MFALVEASGLVGADAPFESAGFQFFLEQFLQLSFAFRIAAGARTSRRALVAADEHVLLELGHDLNLQEGRPSIAGCRFEIAEVRSQNAEVRQPQFPRFARDDNSEKELTAEV
jgi:hypothetical protein